MPVFLDSQVLCLILLLYPELSWALGPGFILPLLPTEQRWHDWDPCTMERGEECPWDLMPVSEQESEKVTSIVLYCKMDVIELVGFLLPKFLLPIGKCSHNEVRNYDSQRILTLGNMTLLQNLKILKIFCKRIFWIKAYWNIVLNFFC